MRQVLISLEFIMSCHEVPPLCCLATNKQVKVVNDLSFGQNTVLYMGVCDKDKESKLCGVYTKLMCITIESDND